MAFSAERFSSTLLIFLFLTACSRTTIDPATVYTRVTEASLKAGDSIPAPVGKIVLTVAGLIGAQNREDKIVMDLATIESAGLVEYTVLDPWEDREITYRGVLMSELLALWQIDPKAAILAIEAINDYKVEIPVATFYEFPILFALQSDGKYMPIKDRGPAMLVYPNMDFEFVRPLNDKFWVWQIASIKVK